MRVVIYGCGNCETKSYEKAVAMGVEKVVRLEDVPPAPLKMSDKARAKRVVIRLK